MCREKLTDSQLYIMKILWDSNHPMVASDFIKVDPSQNLNTVQSAIRALTKKNYIRVADIVYSGKVLTRSYEPTLTADEYASENISGVVKNLLSSNILYQYIEKETDEEVIDRLQSLLDKRKKELESED